MTHPDTARVGNNLGTNVSPDAIATGIVQELGGPPIVTADFQSFGRGVVVLSPTTSATTRRPLPEKSTTL